MPPSPAQHNDSAPHESCVIQQQTGRNNEPAETGLAPCRLHTPTAPTEPAILSPHLAPCACEQSSITGTPVSADNCMCNASRACEHVSASTARVSWLTRNEP